MISADATSAKMQPLHTGAHLARAPLALALTLCSALSAEGSAFAATEGVIGRPALAATLAPAASAPTYSLPWQLRPVTIGNVVRIVSAAAAFKDANGNLDLAFTTVLAASYQLTEDWAPILRLGFIGNDAPGAALDDRAFANPLVGATYARRLGSYSLALFGATTIPIGTGGGSGPSPAAARTNAASITARPADSAMFEVNYLTAIVGIDFAYVNRGFTAQGEASLLQLTRVRGNSSADATDPFRTNSSLGLHLGYFMGSHFSLGGDLHYQRWLSHPTTLDPNTGAHVPRSDANMDVVTVAGGARLHFRLGNHGWIRPGISYVRGFDARGLDAPLITAQTNAVHFDIPVLF